uniref:PNPL.18 n=1 Tax=Nocardiopsis sp. 25L-1-1c TaxID=1009683 RepID=R4HCJ4_9ACTN|nr:pNPL.18 [Nocardiopsis sp. 25L-1-1c]
MHHRLTPPERDAARCCGSSVGALARRRTADGTAWEYLLIGRAWWPIGWAPVAGHVWDAHTDVLAALVAELREEAGLILVAATLLFEADLGNLCQAPPSKMHGHHWWVYLVDVSGELAPDMAETTGARWVSEDELQRMANATITHALAGHHARDLAPTALEAVWVELMVRAGAITATPEARVAVARLYSTPPDEEWIPTA